MKLAVVAAHLLKVPAPSMPSAETAGANVSIGFAAFDRMVAMVINELIAHGEVQHGRIGTGIQVLTRYLG
ncbi:hypothetical protein NXC12_PD00145 (plasmid) [Rhizobium etli]|uniref:Uncharacterized protein n=1 Tax=Rhizobium etli TaxID=29449 RepID=A0AAN1BL36_RHIET|nr:hypothetical protein NXC12_PD00145 [Rhizobium etli]